MRRPLLAEFADRLSKAGLALAAKAAHDLLDALDGDPSDFDVQVVSLERLVRDRPRDAA